MERARHRKTKSVSGIEGGPRIRKYSTVTGLLPDPSSCIDGSTRNDKFTLGLGQSSSGRATGRLLTKLLAEEMYKDIQSRRQSPSVIAKLMGLEGLPSLWHVHRPKERSSDCKKNVSINIQPNRQRYDDRYNRRSPMQQQESNDVYYDLEASHFANPRCSSRWSASSMLTKSEMALIEKYIDAKRYSTNETMDEKLQDSKDLDDTLDMLYSKEDLLMKSVRQPDSSLANNLHDGRVTPSNSLRRHTVALKPRSSAKYEGDAKAWVSERDTKGKHNIVSHPKRKDGLLLETHNPSRAHISRKSSSIQPEEKNEDNIPPTRIVVLRPNLGDMHNAGASVSSPDHSHGYVPDFRKMKEYASVGGAEKQSWRRNDSYHNLGFSKPVSREAREIAREITRRMRGGYDETADAKSSGVRGYGGDESSYDAHKSDFDSELDMFKFPYGNSSRDDNNWGRYPSSSSVELSVNREAKKRLSERWRTTNRYQDLEIVGEGSTLGEMLAEPDGETRSKNYANMTLGGASTRSGNSNRSVMRDDPSGISSRDGWKDETHRTSRSRLLPPSLGGRSHRRSTYPNELAKEKHMMCSDPMRSGRSKVVKGNPIHKELISSQGSRSRSKKPVPCQHMFTNDMNSSTKANFEIQMEANVKDLSEQQLMLRMAGQCDSSGSHVAIAEHGSTAMPSKSSVLHPKLSSLADNDKAAANDQEESCLQELDKGPPEEGTPSLQYAADELAPVGSSGEANHASPISVLEVPFVEDASSSSESFERVSAEMNDLRMQLQLLKMEAGTYTELSTLVPTEEDAAQLSKLSNGNYILGAEGWEVSYALDILIHSGLQESGFDVFKIMWHSPDSPLDPNLFDKLEKKYSNDTTEMRLERKLFFNRINSALFDIFQQHVDFYPWVMPKLAEFNPKGQKERVKDALEKLINEESVNGQLPERMLDKEMQWQDCKGEVDGIGKEIEKLLIDDMITEFLCKY